MFTSSERVACASACEHGRLHVNPDYAYVETVDGEGDVVGTTFHHHAMPLLRYRLGDRSRWKPGQCLCGRVFPMLESVSGKFVDAITGSNGAPVSPSVLTFAFKRMDRIRKSQVAQVGRARWKVRVEPRPGFAPHHQQYLIDTIQRMVAPHVLVKVVPKDDLPATAAGKFRRGVNDYVNAAAPGS